MTEDPRPDVDTPIDRPELPRQIPDDDRVDEAPPPPVKKRKHRRAPTPPPPSPDVQA